MKSIIHSKTSTLILLNLGDYIFPAWTAKSPIDWPRIWRSTIQQLYQSYMFNTFRPRQTGRHFTDDIFKCIFLNENVWIPIQISLNSIPKGPINYIPALVQIRAWHRPGDKPLSEPMMVSLPTHIRITRPQWVNALYIFSLPSTKYAIPFDIQWIISFKKYHSVVGNDTEYHRNKISIVLSTYTHFPGVFFYRQLRLMNTGPVTMNRNFI